MTPSTPSTSKGRLHTMRFCALALVAAGPLAANAYTKTYMAECYLSDGSKFELRAKFERSIFSVGHSAGDTPASTWDIFYKSKSKFRVTQVPGTIPFGGADDPDCTQVGLFRGTPVAFSPSSTKAGAGFHRYSYRTNYIVPPRTSRQQSSSSSRNGNLEPCINRPLLRRWETASSTKPRY